MILLINDTKSVAIENSRTAANAAVGRIANASSSSKSALIMFKMELVP
jgi:hypothetical protein